MMFLEGKYERTKYYTYFECPLYNDPNFFSSIS